MTAIDFIKAWNEKENNLRPISLETLNKFELTSTAKTFLHEAGLPSDAAPFVSFVADQGGNDKFSSIGRLTDWFDFLDTDYQRYIVIGSDGCGDLIVLNRENNCVVEWLDHEDFFSSRFMNSSIEQLANCLLAYRQFVQINNQGKSAEELLETNFTDNEFDTLKTSLHQIDERCVQEGFWKAELDSLLANREDTLNKN